MSFSHQRLLMAFYWGVSDRKSTQISRILLSNQANLNNAVLWIVFPRLLISKSSSPCTNPLVAVSSTPSTISITITFLFDCFSSSLARSRYLTLFSFSFSFTLWSAGTAASTIRRYSFYFGCWLSLGLVVLSSSIVVVTIITLLIILVVVLIPIILFYYHYHNLYFYY